MPRFRPIVAGLAFSLLLQAGCRSANSLASRAIDTPSTATLAPPAAPTAPAAAPAAPATLPPLLVGNTAEVAADAVDATAKGPRGRSLVGLARRFLGRPYQAFSLDQGPGERLRLDLTHFDCFLFVEQLLALVNSHRVSTRTAAVEDFSRHVQKLRYEDGQVDYCHRHHYFSRWAAAAERQGYVVNLTPFLPGAVSRSRRLNFMSTHAASYAPLKQPRNLACIQALEKDMAQQRELSNTQQQQLRSLTVRFLNIPYSSGEADNNSANLKSRAPKAAPGPSLRTSNHKVPSRWRRRSAVPLW